MTRFAILLAAGAVMAGSAASAADRLTDKDVKQLVARIEQGRDRFDDVLDGDVKKNIIRESSGEVKVDTFLNDFQENIDRLEERLKPDYAASAEVATLLRQGSLIDAYLKRQPPGLKGASEWNRLATDLKTLANAYGADFPLAGNATVRRIGDGEVVGALEGLAKSAQQLKKSLGNDLKKDASVDKAAREGIVRDAELLAKDAKAVSERVKDGSPSSAEAERLMAQAARVQSFIDSHRLATSAGPWAAVKSRLQVVAAAYGIPG